jgi:hypothetical protein
MDMGVLWHRVERDLESPDPPNKSNLLDSHANKSGDSLLLL